MSNSKLKAVSISNVQVAAVVGNYRVEKRLGSGGQGEVFLARDMVLGRHVALKLFRDDNKGSLGLSEARLLSTVEHPNIVRIYHAEKQNTTWYLVMEYLEGGDIEEKVLKYGAVSQTSALRIMLGISKALHYAHQKGIIHRDIKPKNLLLTNAGAVKLADFGLAAKTQGLDGKAQPAGTPLYCAPELWRDEPATVRSDLYSLGATIYFLLTKQPPFNATTVESLKEAHLHQQPARPPQVPDSLWSLLSIALSKDPKDRYQSAEEFYQATAAALESLLVIRNEAKPTAEHSWLSPNAKRAADRAVMQLEELAATKQDLQQNLQTSPILTLSGASEELRTKLLESILPESGKTFSLAARCVLGQKSQDLLPHLSAQLRVPLAPEGDNEERLLQGLAPKPGGLPMLYTIDLQRPLRFAEATELCNLAQLAAQYQVIFLLHGSSDCINNIADFADALGAESFFSHTKLPPLTFELCEKIAQRWTWEASLKKLRWTEDALLLLIDALHEGFSLFSLLHNASFTAKLLDRRLITTWCVLAAKEQNALLQQPEDLPIRWRTAPILWPDQRTIEQLQQIRSSLLETTQPPSE